MKVLIHRNVDPLIFESLDNRSLIRCGWVNQYFRRLSKALYEKMFKRLDPWIHDEDPNYLELIWKMSMDVYNPRLSLPFYINADKRIGFYEISRRGYRRCFIHDWCSLILCTNITHCNNIVLDESGKRSFLCWRITRTSLPMIRQCHIDAIRNRWYSLFPNEREIWENLDINPKGVKKRKI